MLVSVGKAVLVIVDVNVVVLVSVVRMTALVGVTVPGREVGLEVCSAFGAQATNMVNTRSIEMYLDFISILQSMTEN